MDGVCRIWEYAEYDRNLFEQKITINFVFPKKKKKRKSTNFNTFLHNNSNMFASTIHIHSTHWFNWYTSWSSYTQNFYVFMLNIFSIVHILPLRTFFFILFFFAHPNEDFVELIIRYNFTKNVFGQICLRNCMIIRIISKKKKEINFWLSKKKEKL